MVFLFEIVVLITCRWVSSLRVCLFPKTSIACGELGELGVFRFRPVPNHAVFSLTLCSPLENLRAFRLSTDGRSSNGRTGVWNLEPSDSDQHLPLGKGINLDVHASWRSFACCFLPSPEISGEASWWARLYLICRWQRAVSNSV